MASGLNERQGYLGRAHSDHKILLIDNETSLTDQGGKYIVLYVLYKALRVILLPLAIVGESPSRWFTHIARGLLFGDFNHIKL